MMDLYKYYKQLDGVTVKEDKKHSLASVKYADSTIDWSLPHVLDARGLVIDLEGKVVGRPYDKFFNWKELEKSDYAKEVKDLSEWKDEPFILMDKADGSLVIAYMYKGELFLSSSGSVDNEASADYKKTLLKYPKKTQERMKEVCEKYTLSMEYVSPEKQIVLLYQETKFMLHGARVTETGEYLTLDELKQLSEYLGIELIKIYEGITTLDELLVELDSLKMKEGFVVWFTESDFRLKFKTQEYLELHKAEIPVSMGGFKTQRFITSLVETVEQDSLDDYVSQINQKRHEDEKTKTILDEVSKLCLQSVKKANEEFYGIEKFFKSHEELLVADRKTYHELLTEYCKSLEMFNVGVAHKITGLMMKGDSPLFAKMLTSQASVKQQFKDYLEKRIFAMSIKELLSEK